MKVKLANRALFDNRIQAARMGSAARYHANEQGNAIGVRRTLSNPSDNQERSKNLDGTGMQSEQIPKNRERDENVPTIASLFLKETWKDPVKPTGLGQSKTKVNNEMDSVIQGIAPALLLGQCFSLLGISNVACQHGREPHFRWFSLRMLFSVIVSSLIGMMSIFVITYYIDIQLLNRVVIYQGSIFFLNCCIASCLFIRLGRRWSTLCTAFHNLENQLRGYGNSRGLERRLKRITAVVLSLALVENAIAQTNTFLAIRHSVPNNSVREWLEKYYDSQYTYISYYLPYSLLGVIVAFLVNTTATFIWNFNDLFIMLMSEAIASKFQVLNDFLEATSHQEKDVKSWRHIRETFNALSSLTHTVEDNLRSHVLLSVANNVFFICVQLLQTVRYTTKTPFASFYSAISFILLVLRAVSASLYAASIPEKSRAIKRVLFSVNSKEYCVEVDRLINQVSFDDIALTGCNFFSVTRSFLLAVFGTIATYEILLVQFNSLHSN